jgi:dUTP pyrophosphatase|tara:strand:- start:174 stop:656 length:483 start_codon:yes stop_codon:yes gene_type:complete
MKKEPIVRSAKGVRVVVKRLPHGIGLDLPVQATPDSAGVDLMAALNRPVLLAPSNRSLIPTGICIQLPIGFEAQIRPRSGLAIKNGITILNSPGTIDADYRGEIKVILANLSTEAFRVERSMRIAQLVISPVVQPIWDEVLELDDTKRGKGGFGSTGTRT